MRLDKLISDLVSAAGRGKTSLEPAEPMDMHDPVAATGNSVRQTGSRDMYHSFFHWFL